MIRNKDGTYPLSKCCNAGLRRYWSEPLAFGKWVIYCIRCGIIQNTKEEE